MTVVVEKCQPELLGILQRMQETVDAIHGTVYVYGNQ
jgi:hypothetical protein